MYTTEDDVVDKAHDTTIPCTTTPKSDDSHDPQQANDRHTDDKQPAAISTGASTCVSTDVEKTLETYAFTPKDERDTLAALPDRYDREEIHAMCDALIVDIQQDPPGLTSEQRVHRHARKHRFLLVAMPFLFRSICRGTYRRHVVDAILDARDKMDAGTHKDKALEELIVYAVKDVKGK